MVYLREHVEHLEGYTPGFQPKEPGFIKLNTNENPYPPSPRATEAMRRACGEGIRKYPDPLATSFREAAGELLGVPPEWMICGFGSDDILTIAVRAFCGEGETVAFPYPSYSLYEVLGEIQCARPVSVDFPPDYSTPEGLADIDAPLTFLANPNAPSGTMLASEDVRRLAGGLSGALVIDEAYVDFAEGDCLELVEECDNVVVTRTLSKSYSLAGLRFGFAVANEELIAGMMKVKDSYNVSAPGVAGATEAIKDQQWVNKNILKIKSTRKRLISELQEQGFSCWPSRTNFVLARVPGGDARTVFEQLLERKILVRYFDLPRLDDCLRVTVGTDEEIDAFLEATGEIVG